ncbi:MAG: single-stranded DNA-binding protein [Anaerolineales bacterium]
MTRGLNKVMLIGRLGQEPEMRYTPSGRPLTKLQIAVNRSWKSSDGEKKTETEWFNIVAWGKLAEICNQYLSKGQQVYIEGRLHTRQWQDDEGNNHSSVEVIAQEMLMLDSKFGEQDPELNEGLPSENEYPF